MSYATSELINNVVQHSEKNGAVVCQYFPTKGHVQIVVADCGIGIRESFLKFGSPAVPENMSHVDAIKTCLQPRVSSKTHIAHQFGGAVNAGVGLTILREICSISGGKFWIVSHNGVVSLTNFYEMPNNQVYFGTVCAISLKRDSLRDWAGLLRAAKANLGLITKTNLQFR